MKKLYLLTYNFISLTLWLNIFFNIFFADNFYVEVVSIIKLVQTLACLEIIHSFLGLSSSVKVPSILQITARLILLASGNLLASVTSKFIIVTNQSGISRGIIEENDLVDINNYILDTCINNKIPH